MFHLLAAVVLSTTPAGNAADLPRDAVEGLSGLPVPRFVSLSSGQANMRTGPGERYPIIWLYHRKGLPLKVVKEYGIWREVVDPDGAKGWMHRTMVSGQRTAMVRNGLQGLRARPEDTAPILWRIEPGVVGTISDCGSNWCRLTVENRSGYIRYEGIWGITPGETLE
jgi:SH3-like domain-containing protein